jgi:hypothetical protein
VSQPIVVTVSPKNGFTDTVSVSIQGLPANALSMPPAPLAIPPARTQQVTFFFPPSTTTGSISLSFAATGGGLSHTAALNFTLNPVSGTVVLQETTGEINAGTIEIRGLARKTSILNIGSRTPSTGFRRARTHVHFLDYVAVSKYIFALSRGTVRRLAHVLRRLGRF